MASNPDDIELTPALREQIAELARKRKCGWEDLLRALLVSAERSTDPETIALIEAQDEVLSRVWDNEEDSVFDDL